MGSTPRCFLCLSLHSPFSFLSAPSCLANTLLQEILHDDPLLFRKYKATKGINKGNLSFDGGTSNVLAALTSNKPGFAPRLVSGKPIKSLNQYYNKQRAQAQSHLSHENRFTSRRLDRVTTKRNRRVDSYLHTASHRIIDLLVSERIGTLVIGKNPLWKQEANMRRKNNQQFVQIPHARFIDQLTYKAQLVGIKVVITAIGTFCAKVTPTFCNWGEE